MFNIPYGRNFWQQSRSFADAFHKPEAEPAPNDGGQQQRFFDRVNPAFTVSVATAWLDCGESSNLYWFMYGKLWEDYSSHKPGGHIVQAYIG